MISFKILNSIFITFLGLHSFVVSKEKIVSSISLNNLPRTNAVVIDQFERVSFWGQSDDTSYARANHNQELGTIFCNSIWSPRYNFMSYKDKEYVMKRGLASAEVDSVGVDAAGSNIYKVKIGKNTYYYFYCGGGPGSGRAQYLRYYTVFSETMAPITMLSWFKYENSFCDLNHDGNLDFIEFEMMKKLNQYTTKTWTLKNDKFVPLKSKFNNRFFSDEVSNHPILKKKKKER